MLLSHRTLIGELMDKPSLPTQELEHALQGLRRINRVSFASLMLWRGIRTVVPNGSAISVLDLGCGSADVLTGIAQLAARDGYQFQGCGVDANHETLAIAERLRPPRVPIHFLRRDVLRDDLPQGFDIVTSSLFLHHFSDAQVCALLRRMATAAQRAIVVSDLVRSFAGYLLSRLVPPILTRSGVVHVDSVRSVRAAFTRNELRRLAEAAGLEGAEVRGCIPSRTLLTWTRGWDANI